MRGRRGLGAAGVARVAFVVAVYSFLAGSSARISLLSLLFISCALRLFVLADLRGAVGGFGFAFAGVARAGASSKSGRLASPADCVGEMAGGIFVAKKVIRIGCKS